MTSTAGTKPHPIFLAGRWVESDDPLVVTNPANPDEPAGTTFNASEAQYEEAVEAAVAAFEVTRTLPAYERGANPAEHQRGDQGSSRQVRLRQGSGVDSRG